MSMKDTGSALSGGDVEHFSMHGTGLSRSYSFTGLSQPAGSPTSPTTHPVLGELYRSPRSGRKTYAGMVGLNLKKSAVKVPKVPHPDRTRTMLERLIRGIRECILATEEDLATLHLVEDTAAVSSSSQVRVHELEKQMKAAERYKKRLEFHLTKVEELEEQYMLHLQLREGVENMAKAFYNHSGSSKKESLSHVKCGYKECTQTLCVLEAQLENLLGTFHCKMKGLLGFARLMPGDTYEVTVRHGQQKWKTKGKIGASTQNWDTDVMVFKALVNDIFLVKAVEVKTLGKHVMLGQKNCETSGLFSSHPQLMTVSINSHGTIKLSIVVSWNPLEGIDESVGFTEAITTLSQGTPRRRFVTSMSMIEGTGSLLLNGGDSMSHCSCSLSDTVALHRHSMGRFSSVSSVSSSQSEDSSNQPCEHCCHNNRSPLAKDITRPHSAGVMLHSSARPHSVAVMNTLDETGLSGSPRSNSLVVRSDCDVGMVKPQLLDLRGLAVSQEDWKHHAVSLEDALHNLKSLLEDYQGQYTELQKLEEQVHAIDRMIKKQSGAGSGRESDVSISIETALNAFNFLEQEYYVDGYGSANNSRRSSLDQLEAKCSLSPESTTKTADSGIESIARRLSEDHHLDASLEATMDLAAEPEHQHEEDPEQRSHCPSTGNGEVDMALMWHLQYCDRLLQNLGTYGPLKCKEIYSLDKLSHQAVILDRLTQLAKSGPQVNDLQEAMSQLTTSKELRHLWARCVESTVLHTSADRLLAQLEKSFGDFVREQYEVSSTKVFKLVMTRILDMACFDPESCYPSPIVTMHQVFCYFSDQHQCSVRDLLQDLAAEVWLNERLKCGSADLVIKTLLTFKEHLPPPECLRIVALLLITDNLQIRQAAAQYVKTLCTSGLPRQKAVVVYVEALEDVSADLRSAACITLRLLVATECIDQLVYVSHSDSSGLVKQAAKETLLSLGEEARKAYEESQLTVHGFQGVKVHL